MYINHKEITLSIPIDILVDREDNVYEMTCVAISLSNVLSAGGDKEIESNNKKIVSIVLERVLTEDVEYSNLEKE
jgi:DNA-directed RNA polymerase subunit K/omega